MKPLATSQRVFKWFCVYPANENIQLWIKALYIIFTIAIGIFEVCAICTSAAFILKFMSTDFESPLFAFLQVLGHTVGLYGLFFTLVSRREISAIFERLTEIYNENTDEMSCRYLIRANNTSEWLWKMYFTYVMLGTCINLFGTCLVSTVWSFHIYGYFKADYIFRPYKMVFPWDYESPYGYLLEVIYAVIISEAYFIANGSLIILFISLCLHHRAFFHRFELFTRKLNQIKKIPWIKPNQTKTTSFSAKRKDEEKKLLFELIRFHISAKSFFLETAHVYSPHIAIILICSTLMMTCDVFHIDLQMKHIDSRIIIVLIGFFCGLSNLFVYCYFGKEANESFSKMNDCLYESSWHDLPLDLQKLFPILIRNTQKPIFYSGFGVAVLQLETLQKLLKTVVTYYMTLKAITTH